MTTPTQKPPTLSLAEKRALLDRMLKERNTAPPPEPLGRRPAGEPEVASPGEERLWLFEQMNVGQPVYNSGVAWRLRGPLSLPALQHSLDALVARHDALRTTFHSQTGRPVPVVAPAAGAHCPLPVEDCEAALLEQRLLAEYRRPFDLRAGPLFRPRLFRLGGQEHVLLFGMHHAILDGWSLGVLTREFSQLYRDHRLGTPTVLPALELEYRDFARWQRRRAQGPLAEAQLAFWRKQLQGAPMSQVLPALKPVPLTPGHAGARQTFLLSPGVGERLEALGRAEGASMFMVLLAGVQALLARYTSQREVLFGTSTFSRSSVETEGMLGFFVNTVMLRTDASGGPGFRQLIQRAKAVVLDAFSHQDVPFEQVLRETFPHRPPGKLPFEVMLEVHNEPLGTPELEGLAVDAVRVEHGTATFDLTFHFERGPAGWQVTLEHRLDLLDPDEVRRMGGHLATLLEAAGAQPEAPVESLPLLSPGEQRQLLVEWNDTHRPLPPARALHQLFEGWVERTPEAVALTAGDQQYSYAALDAQANSVAAALTRLGVGPEMRVALYLDRSVELVVALLGTLKAGAAYVPVEPSLPEARAAFLLEDTGAPVVITSARCEDSLPSQGQLVLRVEDLIAQPAPATRVDGGAGPQHLAYVLYTSGSTGRPKGVMVTHGGVLNYLAFAAAEYGAAVGRGAPVHSPVGFDLTVTSLLVPLVSGNAAHLLPDRDGVEALAAHLRSHPGQSLVKLTPAHLEILRHQIPAERAAGLTATFVIGGEALTAEQLAFWRRHAPATRLINEYGPTETVVGCCIQEVLPGEEPPALIPIGRPIPNTRLYVLDRQLRPVPVGVAGELFIAGAGVARGYLGRPDLTAERFIPDPFGEPGGRLYRSGDLARYRADGVLEYLGRIDEQVKIRGYRVELGEIEATLSRLPGLREVAVALKKVEGDSRLVAYLVPEDPEQPPTLEQLQAYLKNQLPPYMVPVAAVVQSSLPLSTNGKVDRAALPVPGLAAGRSARRFQAPEGHFQIQVAQIWAAVLGVDRVGAGDDFFELGGHSLLATQVISRVRQELGLELAIREIFEARTVAALAQVIEGAVQARRQPRTPPLVASGEGGPIPLSFSQERLWYLDQLEPGKPTFNVPFGLWLSGELEPAALEWAFAQLLRRHEPLRTTFTQTEGGPLQRIAPAGEFTLGVDSLAHLPRADRREAALALARAESETPFDLQTGPLFRARLVRLDLAEHMLLITLHHVISDAWSAALLTQELAQLYQARVAGAQESPLAPLGLQYADFARWQKRWQSGAPLEEGLGYWKKKLAALPPPLQLPTDRARPPVQTFRGAIAPLSLPSSLYGSLRALSEAQGVSLFMTLQAAFLVLLHRYTGAEDLILGSPVANRNPIQTEQLLGIFVNPVALRTDLGGDPRFVELLRRVRETSLEAYAHQEVPFFKVVEAVRPSRDVRFTPIFQVAFILQNTRSARLPLPGIETAPVTLGELTAFHDLSLEFEEDERGLQGYLEYNTDLFAPAAMAQMAEQLVTLLEAVVATPQAPISRLPVLTGAQRSRLVEDFNGPRVARAEGLGVVELFERQVRATPDNLAVIQEHRSLRYAELNSRANRLARLLRGWGVGPEVQVGLCVDKSLEMLVGLWGILKAGGAYVPLDAAYPRERLAQMAQDAGLKIVLTQEALRGLLPPGPTRVLSLDKEWWQAEALEDSNLPTPPLPQSTAYVIYTSGSTGRPKGVQISHASLANFVQAARTEYQMSPADRVLQFASISWDTSAEELYPCLTSGGAVVLREKVMVDSVEGFLDRAQAHGLTVVNLPTAFWHVLTATLRDLQRPVPPSLRLVIIGGERALSERVAQWGALGGDSARLVNTYGLTEVTAVATSGPLLGPEAGAAAGPVAEVSIGRPIQNVRTYVLNRGLEPVPVGVTGELFIGGAGCARGYLGEPEMTAGRFLPDPFSSQPGARMYASGDLARWRPDGQLECVGRRDSQVKVRGYRIELGEIETALSVHPGLKEVAVVARDEGAGEKRLVAYLVPAAGPLEAEAVQSYLRGRLPEYMVPAVFVTLERLPLTPNGKLDRKALPDPGQARAGTGRPYLEPRTATERKLCQLWSQLLRVDRVGVDDEFFALGGHSLLATQIASRVRKEFAVELPLRTFLEVTTVAALAANVEAALAKTRQAEGPALTARPPQGPLPLSFAQERMWFFEQFEPGTTTYSVPLAIRIRGALDQDALDATLTALVARHQTLRTVYDQQGGVPFQQVRDPAPVRATRVTLGLPASEAQLEAWVEAQLAQPFDLAREAPFRASVARVGEADFLVLLNLHHIAVDGWSVGVLFADLQALYSAQVTGAAPALPPLPVGYTDYARWQRESLAGPRLEQGLRYWKDRLAHLTPLELPTDHPRAQVRSPRGGKLAIALPTRVTERLRALAARENCTPFMVVQAALDVLLARYSGQADVTVGGTIANRTRSEVEGLLGLFMNTLVFRARVEPGQSFLQLLDRVRESSLQAYAHQDIPFEKVVEAVQPDRDLARTPLFQVMLLVQNVPYSAPRLEGVEAEMVELPHTNTMFDLMVNLHDDGDRIAGLLEFNRALFEPGTIERLGRHLVQLLDDACLRPGAAVDTLQLLDPEERRAQLEAGLPPPTAFDDQALPGWVGARLAAAPGGKVAVAEGERTLTYRQLDQLTHALAHRLVRAGVGPDVCVGLYLERSLEIVPAALAVWKAGGAYVPLDPRYPADRLGYVVQDSGMKVVLTVRALAAEVAALGIPYLCLDDGAPSPEAERAAPPRVEASPQNLGYVIYTSGSTGRPKGVAVTQRNVVHMFTATLERLRVGPDDVWLAVSSPSFDISVAEFLGAVLVGARVEVATTDEVTDGQRLLALIQRLDPTLMWGTPTLFRMLLDAGWPERPGSHLRIGPAGEALEPALVSELAKRTREIWNVYGPTEITVHATCSQARAGEEVSIGHWLGNARLYILDPRGNPVPEGVMGELFVGGDGVARGYLGQPALTASRFVPDPFASRPGARMYRTGDLVRRRPGGVVLYCGRADHQIKLRGHRIELGEIEAVLSAHPQVREAAVILLGDRPEDRKLVAYVAPRRGTDPTVAQLRDHVRDALPQYMVPGQLVLLEALPKLPNGKLDRASLPAPDPAAGATPSAQPPATPTEQQVAGVWAEVLGISEIGREDSFFELGGHSLLVTKVVSRLQTLTGVRVTVRDLFDRPVLSDFAANLARAAGGEEAPEALLARLGELSDAEVEALLKEHGRG